MLRNSEPASRQNALGRHELLYELFTGCPLSKALCHKLEETLQGFSRYRSAPLPAGWLSLRDCEPFRFCAGSQGAMDE
jgi:hypothetical protein